MITTTVVGKIKAPDGTVVENAEIIARLNGFDYDPDFGYITSRRITTTTDVNGEFSFELWPNTRGTEGSIYRIAINSPINGVSTTFTATIPEQAEVELNDASDFDPVPPLSDAEQLVNEAKALRDEARDWASEDEDVVVKDGLFSALHYSAKSEDSAIAAAASESNAAASESNAATSAQNAADSFDSFDDRYLGAKSSESSTDNDGDPLQTGALYFDTTLDELRVYDGTQWLSTDYNSANVTITGGSITGTDVDVSGATFTVADDQISGDAINGGTATPTALNVDSGTLFVDSANNRVGIGKSSPETTLDVNGDIRAEKSRILPDGSVADGDASAPHYSFYLDQDTGVFRATTNVLGFSIGGSEAMRIDSSGNVGIGTSSPQEKLDVNGQINADRINIKDDALILTNYSGGDIANLVSGSDFGSLIEGRESGHIAIGIRGNDSNDSFAIVSGGNNYAVDNTYDKLCMQVTANGNATINGSLSKNSGSFRIDHPLPEKSETHHLVHSFVESPRADNVYRGTATLSNGTAQVNLDAYVGMTEGTFSALNGNIDVFLQNKTGWEPLKGEVIDNILHVYCRDETATDTISWMVVGERQDQHMLDTNWTDEFGRPILEPEKEIEQEIPDDE